MNPFTIKLAIIAAIMLGTFGAGWKTRDAFCDAAAARKELQDEKDRHEATKTDLAAATNAARVANAAIFTIGKADTARQEIIHERQIDPAPAGALRCKLGNAGVEWLRKIAPD